MICPGFSSDCVETLEEIAIQGKETFIESGGKNFDLISCLNDNDDHIKMMENIVKTPFISYVFNIKSFTFNSKILRHL